jgi:adenylylsulfate kinase-like enzyme
LRLVDVNEFIEVSLDTPLAERMRRDSKGLHARD